MAPAGATVGAVSVVVGRARFAGMPSDPDLHERILDVIDDIPSGVVTTYGEVAADAGAPRHARLVGRLLQTTDRDLPWWRVVNASGRLVPGLETEHARRLRAEGVEVRDGRVRGMRRR